MKRSNLVIVIIVILSASFWVIATSPMFGNSSSSHIPTFLGYR